ncbi:uncharacterized protein YybS (DUF2232 family) [Paenibacillus phyllosphaerae]|uniref:Uncharacterized protein YybS (DUF2232 family) n=1 Tax=Paenibacillus phyllosphaerae TaxID=274593 RepID=A0A7W5AZ09_9BACL|nr:DUF2232 domain-containing protein [Paenibacillus phyllosphaerae]MBB3110896.1 uncharacterized protein YybS (DUF2232 family) [Paenibacillus phyllosphaerae]
MKSIVWSALLLLMLLAIAVPLLNVLSVIVIMVPAVILYVSLTRKAFAIHMLVVYGIALAVLGPASLIVGLFFLVPAIVMGHLYKKQATARKVLTATMLTLLGELLLELVLFDILFGVSMLDEISDMMRQTMSNISAEGMMPAYMTADVTDAFIQTLIHSIPMTLIVVAFLYTVITHAIARPTLAKAGYTVPKLQPAREWMLPRIFVLYYLIVFLADMVVSDQNSSFLGVALLNLAPLMRMAFSIQAIGFFFFVAHERGWNRIVPILLAALIVVFPPLSMIGVFDTAFPIRRAFKKP